MSDTPRTDAEEARYLKAWGKQHEVGASFARELERELNAARSETQPSNDTARMDWLTKMLVEVRKPARWGSRQLIYAQPNEVEGADDEPSDIRSLIDREIARGK